MLVFAVGHGTPSMAVEQATYAVVKSDPPYEMRNYARSVVARVAVAGARSDAVSSGFRLLANYIFGSNQQKSKIDMTAPVTQTSQSAEPASTSSQDAAVTDAWIVRFVMPASYTLQSLPAPSDGRIHLEESQPHCVAAIRFSGFWSDSNFKSHEMLLLRWIQTQHLTPRAPPTYAYYDPPWTPWFMRTIEVLIDVGPPCPT